MDEHKNVGGSSAVANANAILKYSKDASSAVRGSTRGFWRLMPMAPRVCEVTMVQQRSAGGTVPVMALNLRLKSSLDVTKRIQDKFQRNKRLVDEEVREALPTPTPLGELSADQREVYLRSLSRETAYDNEKSIPLRSTSAFVEMLMAYTPPKRGERTVVLGSAEAIVDCPPKSAAQWIITFCSRERMIVDREEGNLARLVIEQSTPYDITVATVKRMPLPLYHREFVNRILATLKVETGDFLVCAQPVDGLVFVGIPTEHDIAEHKPSMRVRAKMPVSFTIKETSTSGVCKIVCISQLDTGGRVPAWAMNKILIQNLSLTHRVQSYFQELRTLEEYDAEDGKALGIRLMFPGGPKYKKRWEMVVAIVDSHAGLRKMAKTYPWLKAFLVAIVCLSFASSVSTKLECLSVLEASKIGRSLAPALKARKTPEAGLYQWKKQNRNMLDLC
jgi:hypothetical protein